MYTGTHDNNTVLGWYRNEIDDPTREYMARYTNRKEYETVVHAMLRTAFSSVSFMAIATMQDLATKYRNKLDIQVIGITGSNGKLVQRYSLFSTF